MTSLQALFLHTQNFYDRSCEVYTRFLRILQSAKRPIRELCVDGWDHTVELTEDTCFLPGMEIFRCRSKFYSATSRSAEQLTRLAVSSRETLHTLELPLAVMEGDEHCALWDARFPHLKDLTVDLWYPWPDDIDVNELSPLKKFLLSHPDMLVSTMRLGFGTILSAKFISVGAKLGYGSLCTTPNAFRKIALAIPEPDFLEKLHTLELNHWTDDPNPFMTTLNRMVEVITHYIDTSDGPLLPSIQHLTLTYGSEDDGWLHGCRARTGIQGFGQFCGEELRTIEVSLPLETFSEEWLTFAFATYPHVEEITIRGGLLQDYESEGKYASAAKAIALHCRSLQKLNFVNFAKVLVERPNVYLLIERLDGEEMTVSQVQDLMD